MPSHPAIVVQMLSHCYQYSQLSTLDHIDLDSVLHIFRSQVRYYRFAQQLNKSDDNMRQNSTLQYHLGLRKNHTKPLQYYNARNFQIASGYN